MISRPEAGFPLLDGLLRAFPLSNLHRTFSDRFPSALYRTCKVVLEDRFRGLIA